MSPPRPARWPVASAVAAADDLMIASLQGPDIGEVVRSHIEQRAPAFTPLPARS